MIEQNINIKVKLTKTQNYAASKLDEHERIIYLLSFAGIFQNDIMPVKTIGKRDKYSIEWGTKLTIFMHDTINKLGRKREIKNRIEQLRRQELMSKIPLHKLEQLMTGNK
jgi:hypothetical protein